ncbi:hypothetical protein [Oceanidesulfovibrio marinus]|uniref:Uncharacterized protein n=1 Tax=Oceanidesulfovibrio marinus TaxID=370038 RepID=A0ABX6NHV0_9BACT|nr:hypothetical protein [Oceanidesulfovibrio marinus]QJT10214.1 hypothetical protein E8L03_15310 [Oceanidesulfovibrio marinus]
MFQPLFVETPAARLVDWMEFRAILHHYNECALDELWESMGIAEDTYQDALENLDPDDVTAICNEDTEREQVLGRIEREIDRRVEALRIDSTHSAYPFKLEDSALQFELNSTIPGQLSYLLCLRLSLAMSNVLDTDQVPAIKNSLERNLFQHCANLAAAGYLGGKTYAFGWPRPDKTGLLDALRALEKEMGSEGVVRHMAPKGAPTRPKDDQVDVVAWIPHHDGPGCALTLWGQVASGLDWEEKPLSTDRIERFRGRWYKEAPCLKPIRAMFVPFSLFDDVYDQDPSHYLAALFDHTREYGIIFHRYRIPLCVQKAFDRGDEVSVMRSLPKHEVASQLQNWWEDFFASLNHTSTVT